MAEALGEDQVKMMRQAFAMFDKNKNGKIDHECVTQFLETMGQDFDEEELENMIKEEDKEKTGKLTFDMFCNIVCNFMEDEDDEAMMQELKEAFRLYDKECVGYIPTSCLREILAACDDKLTSQDLDDMIDEIDSDGSGTVDFEEFMEMMTG